jgi:hypothetical protein
MKTERVRYVSERVFCYRYSRVQQDIRIRLQANRIFLSKIVEESPSGSTVRVPVPVTARVVSLPV